MKKNDYHTFKNVVTRHYIKHGRHNLPWRKTRDPYKILVSEVMLQQTQVERVIPFYRNFLKRFPTVQALAKALLIDVLRVWSGLGYNRRAKYLHDAAKVVVEKYKGKIPAVYSELIELPGVGEYTAKAVRVFAFNQPEILIETNIRSVFIDFLCKSDLHKKNTKISDAQILTFAEEAVKGRYPREWHWALMDYGAHLKRSGVRNNHRSVHHVRQSKFEGSLRQVRGAILRAHVEGTSMNDLRSRTYFARAYSSLVRDGLISRGHLRM